MFIMSKERRLLVLIVAFMLVMTGCSGSSGQDEELSSGEGKLTVNVKLPSLTSAQSLSALNVPSELELSRIEIELTNVDDANDTVTDSQDITNNNTVAFSFDSLTNGAEYDIEVKIKDTADKYVYEGRGRATAKEEASSTPIQAKLLAAEGVVVELTNLPQEAVRAQVSLLPTDIGARKEIDIATTGGIVEFEEEIAASNYGIEVKLFDDSGAEIFAASESDNSILPGRINEITIRCTDGGDGLDIEIDWELAPEAPTALTAEIADDGAVNLSWDDTTAEYLIYRGERTNSRMPLTETAIGDNSYTDRNTAGNRTYYYWVRGVSPNGLNGDFSEVVEVTNPDWFAGVKIYYKDTSGTPTIWIWEQNGIAISEEMGYTWYDQPDMTAVSGADDWYVFKIADEYLSDQPLAMKFNSSDPEITLDPADTAWYDGEWHYEAPYNIESTRP